MSIRNFSGANFYQYATDLFVETGHMAASFPEFCNHSAEEYVFLDVLQDAVFSFAQRKRLKQFGCVSKLFTVDFLTGVDGINEKIAFFSIVLDTDSNEKSQAAFDIHTIIHQLTEAEGTVCIFLYEESVLISIAGFGLNCVLSDWFSVYDDTDELHDRLNIGEVCLDSAKAYLASLAYNIAREYYIYPPDPVFAAQRFLPADIFTGYDSDLISREELSDIVRKELYADIYAYGDDYVEHNEKIASHGIEISDELALMMLDLDEEDDNPFGEELEPEDDLDHDEFAEEERDDYEFEDVDPEIFKDPALMVQWLEQGAVAKANPVVETEEFGLPQEKKEELKPVLEKDIAPLDQTNAELEPLLLAEEVIDDQLTGSELEAEVVTSDLDKLKMSYELDAVNGEEPAVARAEHIVVDPPAIVYEEKDNPADEDKIDEIIAEFLEAQERERIEAEFEKLQFQELERKRQRYIELCAKIEQQRIIISESKGWFGAKAKARKNAQEELNRLSQIIASEFPHGKP